MKTLIGITGTTSVGKSAVGVELARMLDSEIISADSMQIYKGMDIGTAKITPSEMCGIAHHMIDIVNPNENYSSFLYQQDASRIIDNMDGIPIVVGGTGFYFNSLVYPPEFGGANGDRRAELKKVLVEQGLDTLKELLKVRDVDAYNRIDLNNPVRVLRALEIAESGEKFSAGDRKNAAPKYDLKLFVLARSRESLYEQIERRVDEMIALGLVEEVKGLVKKYGHCDTSAFKAIGYKEVIECLDGLCTLDDAVAKIKLNSRHYAKRQETYFKKMDVLEYIDVEGKSACDIAKYIKTQLTY